MFDPTEYLRQHHTALEDIVSSVAQMLIEATQAEKVRWVFNPAHEEELHGELLATGKYPTTRVVFAIPLVTFRTWSVKAEKWELAFQLEELELPVHDKTQVYMLDLERLYSEARDAAEILQLDLSEGGIRLERIADHARTLLGKDPESDLPVTVEDGDEEEEEEDEEAAEAAAKEASADFDQASAEQDLALVGEAQAATQGDASPERPAETLAVLPGTTPLRGGTEPRQAAGSPPTPTTQKVRRRMKSRRPPS